MSAKAWDSAAAARALEQRTVEDLARMNLPPPDEYRRRIRFYLKRLTDSGRTTNGAERLKLRKDHRDSLIELIDAGPTIVKPDQPCGSCIQFRSGAQLAFGIMLRWDGEKSSLLAYRFHLRLLPASGLQFVRIDLNSPKEHYDPLDQPRSHLHPGFEHIHLPFPALEPLAVLDRIVYAIEPRFAQ